MTEIDLATLRFFIWVKLDETGDVIELILGDNALLDTVKLPDISKLPQFVRDKIALLKLTGVNRSNVKDVVGRKMSDEMMILYLNRDEYDQIKEECK